MDWELMVSISTAIIFLISAVLVFYQLREMRKATVGATFVPVISLLQEERVTKARHILMGITETNYDKWTEKEKENAHLAAARYDAVGIMLRRKVIDHKMVTSEWRYSIIKCWEHAQPYITFARRSRGSDYMDDFEWLYKEAKKSEKTATIDHVP